MTVTFEAGAFCAGVGVGAGVGVEAGAEVGVCVGVVVGDAVAELPEFEALVPLAGFFVAVLLGVLLGALLELLASVDVGAVVSAGACVEGVAGAPELMVAPPPDGEMLPDALVSCAGVYESTAAIPATVPPVIKRAFFISSPYSP